MNAAEHGRVGEIPYRERRGIASEDLEDELADPGSQDADKDIA